MQSVHDLVSQVFYTHGLFCASHAHVILVTVCAGILFLCFPLLNAPLPGNIPAEYESPVTGYQVPADSPRVKSDDNTDVTSIPRWYKGEAVGYIQQIVVKATVSPWEPTLHDPIDALHAPLSKVFDILEKLDKFRHQHGGEEKSMVNCCLRVSEPLRSKHSEGLLPQYGCLILSPANMWRKNYNSFIEDKEILKTIYKRYSQALEAPPGIRDILFGLPWRQTGISRYFIRNKQRTISFAITLVLKSYDEGFVRALREGLEKFYPETPLNVNNSQISHIIHLHYKDVNIYFEYIHLIVLYLVLLLYLYFSVKKIDLVKSKWGMALGAVVTVFSSLLISVSICAYFGLNTHLNGGEIFPYLVMLIGIENVLVVTKSVVSTSVELDVRYRVATGLSKEGWYIMKNLMTELFIGLVGFFTFVPAIQEFCLFALVGILSDFFLQMIFFVTILSLDIRRMELSDLHKHRQQESTTQPTDNRKLQPLVGCPFKFLVEDRQRVGPRINLTSGINMVTGLQRSQMHQVTPDVTERETFLDLPRRLRLIYFWARTRVVQRFIMVCSVVWIVLLVYKTGLVHHLTNSTYVANSSLSPSVDDLEQIVKLQEQPINGETGKVSPSSLLSWMTGQAEEEPGSVKHSDLELWRDLSHAHWVTLFGYYNLTIVGKYISILPSIHLSLVVPADDAIQLRVPNWQSRRPAMEAKTPAVSEPKLPTIPPLVLTPPLQVSDESVPDREEKLDYNENLGFSSRVIPVTPPSEPDFLSEEFLRKYYPYLDKEQLQQFYPKSRLEIGITITLAILSVICLSYFTIMLYRCLCSRKYSKWRASWHKSPKYGRGHNYYKEIKAAVPLVLKGHVQEVECLVTDGTIVVSCCLVGQLRVWDSLTGQCLRRMHRLTATPPMPRRPCEGRNIEDSEADRYEEFHGSHSNMSLDSADRSVLELADDKPIPRRRKASGRHEELSPRERHQEQFLEFPDLKHTINLDFKNMYAKGQAKIQGHEDVGQRDKGHGVENQSVSQCNDSELGGDGAGIVVPGSPSKGYDFSSEYGRLFSEQRRLMQEQRVYEARKRAQSECVDTSWNRSKSWSEGDFSMSDMSMNDSSMETLAPPPVWCLAVRGNLIIAGCGNGKIEFWDSTTGDLKCLYAESSVGVTGINFVGRRVIVARLDGSIDFLELSTFQDPKATPLSPSSLNRKIKGHSRHLSHSRTGSDDLRLWNEVIHCSQATRCQAHQRPITVLQTEGGRIVSGSQDFTLKVFRLEDYRCLHTLHGHTGIISCLCLDKCPPYAAVSGSTDGTIRLWDLLNGHCVHKISAHEGSVVGLQCSDVHIISSALDDRMCVWDRKRGQLLYSVEIDTAYSTSIMMISNNFLIIGGQGSVYLWDIYKGECIHVVKLEDRHNGAYIHHIQALDNFTMACDYGSDIKVVHFPVVLEKRE